MRNTTLLDLGRRAYEPVWELQKKLVERRVAGEIDDVLILVEHDPVITLGRRGTRDQVFATDVPVLQVERGGEATYHGPGQLVGYPIVKLDDWPKDVRGFVRDLEEVLLRTAKDFGIPAERHEDHRGVWVGDRKLASIGVAIRHWVTYHGFALNVSTDLSYFHKLRPCGLDPGAITSMELVMGSTPRLVDVKRRIADHYQAVFGAAWAASTSESLATNGRSLQEAANVIGHSGFPS